MNLSTDAFCRYSDRTREEEGGAGMLNEVCTFAAIRREL